MFDLRCSFEWETMGEYLDCIKRQGHAANVFAQVGFGNLRLMASGILPFRSGAGAMKKMKRHLEQALEEGARGFSTGLFYPPQNFAPKEEVIEICKVLSKRNSLYSTHIRNEADLLEESVKEALETAERAGVSLQISHHKAVLRRNWGKVFKTMEMIEAAAKEGLDVETDVYPYSSFSNIVLPLIFFNEPDVEKNIVFLDLNHYKELEGKTLEEAMKARGRGARALVLEMALKEGLTGMPVAGFLISEKDLEFLISHPLVSIGSDGNEAPPGRKTHPRLYGSFSRFLEKYCITDKLLSLEEGVRKITSMPARKLGLDKRGLIKEGWYADIVVFDPVSLRDLADYENPLRHPEGFEAVIVNGALTVQKDVQTSARAGRVV